MEVMVLQAEFAVSTGYFDKPVGITTLSVPLTGAEPVDQLVPTLQSVLVLPFQVLVVPAACI
jgi:hypothetical protein